MALYNSERGKTVAQLAGSRGLYDRVSEREVSQHEAYRREFGGMSLPVARAYERNQFAFLLDLPETAVYRGTSWGADVFDGGDSWYVATSGSVRAATSAEAQEFIARWR
jgi:hypothetical protein